MQQSIPRCEYFAIPPFRYSIIPSNGVTLLNSTHCSLRKHSGSFEHLSPIEMVKWSLFESMKFVFKVSSICRSNLFRHFCKGEVFFFNYLHETPLWNYFEMFIIYCCVTVRTEKIVSLDLLEIIRWFKRQNALSFKEKFFLYIFMMRWSPLLRHFCKEKLSFLTRHSEMIVRCLSSSAAKPWRCPNEWLRVQ